MAEHADPTRVKRISPGARATYPWPTWADGQWWRLREGVDYTTTTKSFRVVARNWAKRHDFKLTSQQTEDGIFIRFTRKT
jgi:hypothetical protein